MTQTIGSVKPKVIYTGPIDETVWDKHPGTLQTFHETGMECNGLILYENGPWDTPNPNFDPTKPEGGHNFKYYFAWEGAFFLEKGDLLEIDGTIYVMVKDHDFARANDYRFSFHPQGFNVEELVKLFYPEKVKATLYRKKKTETT